MPLLKASKSEDVVDRWINLWSVLLFLALALTTCMVPLQPAESGDLNKPEFEASCWCAAQFTESHTEYVRVFCGKMFSDFVQGKSEELFIYQLPMDPIIPESVFKPRPKLAVTNTTKENKISDHGSKYNVPLALFLLAVLLKLPNFCGSLLSCYLGLLNIDQTLECAAQTQYVEEIDRRRALRNLYELTKENTTCRPRALSAIFLAVKLVSCAILLLAVLSTLSMIIPFSNTHTSRTNTTDVYNGVTVDSPYMCEFSIRQMTNRHYYSTQCTFTETQSEDTSINGHRYAAFLKAILAYLVLLLGANVVSVVIWLCRLTMRQCQPTSTSLAPGTALDLHFLLLLSQDNAGPLVTRDLAEGFTDRPNGADVSGKDKEAVM